MTPKKTFIHGSQNPLNNSKLSYENMSMFDLEKDELLYSVKEEEK